MLAAAPRRLRRDRLQEWPLKTRAHAQKPLAAAGLPTPTSPATLFCSPQHTNTHTLQPRPLPQVSSAYSAGPQHHLFSLSMNNIYRQDATSAASDFTRVDGVPVRLTRVHAVCACVRVWYVHARACVCVRVAAREEGTGQHWDQQRGGPCSYA